MLDNARLQQLVVSRVERILHVLSEFEESTAECISEMLVSFSNGFFFEGVLEASRFIRHIDILFVALENIDRKLKQHQKNPASIYSKEPKQLVKKVVFFFSILSGTKETDSRQAATRELISMVTSLAHALKVVIRGALIGSLMLVKRTKQGVTGETDGDNLRSKRMARTEKSRRFWLNFRRFGQSSTIRKPCCTLSQSRKRAAPAVVRQLKKDAGVYPTHASTSTASGALRAEWRCRILIVFTILRPKSCFV